MMVTWVQDFAFNMPLRNMALRTLKRLFFLSVLGGDGGWDHFNWKNVSIEKQELRRQKISQKLTGTKFSDERKLKHSIGHINAYKKDPTKCGMFGKVHSIESKEKMSKAHSGKKNNQYGKMWICNDETHESKPILKTDPIPNGWRKGRFCK